MTVELQKSGGSYRENCRKLHEADGDESTMDETICTNNNRS